MNENSYKRATYSNILHKFYCKLIRGYSLNKNKNIYLLNIK